MIASQVERVRGFVKYNLSRTVNLSRSGYLLKKSGAPDADLLGYLGWVGYGNYGDDVIFEVVRSVFSDASLSLSDAQSLWQSLTGKMSSATNIPTHILGGGTLIFRSQYIEPVEFLLEQKAGLVCFGTGVADTGYWKKTIDSNEVDSLRIRWLEALSKFEYIGVRGPLSKLTLDDLGLRNVEVLGDSALGVSGQCNIKALSTNVIGISLGSHDPIGRSQSEINDIVSRLVREKSKYGFKFRFFQFSDIDLVNSLSVIRASGVLDAELVDYRGDVEKFSLAIKNCAFFIGQRLHAIVMSAAFKIPFISLGYQPKCRDFALSIDCIEYLIDIEKLSDALLSERFELAWGARKEFSDKLGDRVDFFSKLQSERAAEIVRGLRRESA